MKSRTMLIMLSALLGAALAVPGRAETIDGGRFGQVHVSAPGGPIRGFMVLFFSSAAGPRSTNRRLMRSQRSTR